MANFDIAITVPDEKLDTLILALHDYYGPFYPEGGGERDHTVPELKALLDDDVKDMIKSVYKRYVDNLPTQELEL